jgi:syntaxin 1B/2/3
MAQINSKLLVTLNADYHKINSTIKELEQDVDPFEEMFTNVKFGYEQDQKKEIDEKFKSILVKTKQLNKTVKEYENYIVKNADENLMKIFNSRVTILKEKYATLLKKIINVNEKYNSYKKNQKKFNFISEDSEISDKPKYEEDNVSDRHISLDEKTVANQHVQDIYQETRSRNKEVEQLASDVREVYDMFQDFAILIDSQHENIIWIDNTIDEAQVKVQKGNKELNEAIKLQRKSRKKKCCIMTVAIVILIIIISSLGSMSNRFA